MANPFFNVFERNLFMNPLGKTINRIILFLGIAMIAYDLALGIAVRFGQSLQFLWLLGGFICILRWAYWRWADHRNHLPPKGLILPLRALIALCIVVFLIVEGIIAAAGFAPAPQNLDYIVVLGARVEGREPSGVLHNRIEAAVQYLSDNPNTMAVLSGGQGADEEISEAQCMYEKLIAAGIDADRLVLEEQSTDTRENLIFSRKFIPEGASVGLITNDFHIFRAHALAKKLGWAVAGIPVATSWISIPHYFMREFMGVAYETLRGNLAF